MRNTAVMELAIEHIQKMDSDIFGLRNFNNEFIILTGNGNIYRFDGNELRQVIINKLNGMISQYSWSVPHIIGEVLVGNSTIIQLIDLRSQGTALLEVNDKISGLLAISKGLVYWGGGILEGYLGLFSGDNNWRIKTKPIQALTYNEHEERLYIVTLTGLLIALDINRPTGQETLGKIQGRVTKIIKYKDDLILAQPDKISVIDMKSSRSYSINVKPLTLNLSKEILVITTEEGEVILRDLKNGENSSIKVNEIYKTTQQDDDVYVITKDEVIRIIGRDTEKISLEGLPVSHVAIGDGIALSLFNIFMHGTLQPPGINVKATLTMEGGEPVYAVEINARSISSLMPIKSEIVLIETDEGSLSVQLNDEGKATIKLPANKQNIIRATLRQSKLKPTILTLPSFNKSVVENIKLRRGSRLLTDSLYELIIQEVLGSGGFGEVYRVYNTIEDRYVAVKLLRINPRSIEEKLESILDEVSTLSKLSTALNTDRKRVIELYGFHEFKVISRDQEKGKVYGIVMEYADGGSLRNIINSKVPFNERMRLIMLTMETLVKLHEAGVIHGDLKPENVLIKGNNPLLADFGISRIFKYVGEAVAPTGYTLEYAAPEVMRNMISAGSDVYSMGTLIIELLTGDLPVSQSNNLPIKAFNKLRSLDKGYELIALVSHMRSSDPNNRPSMRDAYESLARLYLSE